MALALEALVGLLVLLPAVSSFTIASDPTGVPDQRRQPSLMVQPARRASQPGRVRPNVRMSSRDMPTAVGSFDDVTDTAQRAGSLCIPNEAANSAARMTADATTDAATITAEAARDVAMISADAVRDAAGYAADAAHWGATIGGGAVVLVALLMRVVVDANKDEIRVPWYEKAKVLTPPRWTEQVGAPQAPSLYHLSPTTWAKGPPATTDLNYLASEASWDNEPLFDIENNPSVEASERKGRSGCLAPPANGNAAQGEWPSL
tara:strand:- start:578 stop:1363 length:786 start_codon:yes stop_codon:yes gene_type:complete|eukprot:scaffold38966_cov47-Phaeocystis_antarctica.AAC.1